MSVRVGTIRDAFLEMGMTEDWSQALIASQPNVWQSVAARIPTATRSDESTN